MVFLHEHNAENSAWVRAHDKGIEALQQAFPDRVFITRKENIEPEVDAEQVLEEAQQEAEEAAAQEAAGHAPTKPKPKPKPTPKQKQRPSFRKRMARALRLGKEEQS